MHLVLGAAPHYSRGMTNSRRDRVVSMIPFTVAIGLAFTVSCTIDGETDESGAPKIGYDISALALPPELPEPKPPTAPPDLASQPVDAAAQAIYFHNTSIAGLTLMGTDVAVVRDESLALAACGVDWKDPAHYVALVCRMWTWDDATQRWTLSAFVDPIVRLHSIRTNIVHAPCTSQRTYQLEVLGTVRSGAGVWQPWQNWYVPVYTYSSLNCSL
jgi:hypothetical protein